MRFAPEPAFDHAAPSSTAIVLANLGTPEAPTAEALRTYLAEFLSDPRVVEIPRAAWLPLLHGVILRVRPARSARKYAAIWTPEGSPLKTWTVKQARLLEGYLGQRGHRLRVHAAMRYGQPSVASVLDAAKAAGARRILVVPLYPQYSGPTTASLIDAIGAWSRHVRALPEIRVVHRYHDDRGYIDALAKRVTDHWQVHGRGERLVLSFHGVPKRTLLLGDPYHCECQKTARLLAARLGLKADQWLVTFQSRFGKAEWLQPYTQPVLVDLARQGIRRVDVMCPGFVADCLETLEEIGQEARSAFLAAGGQDFQLIPCLNDQHEWIRALMDIALRHMQDWDTGGMADPAELEARRARAVRLGARA